MKVITRRLSLFICAAVVTAQSFICHAEILQPGQLLTLVLTEGKTNAEPIREKYFSYAFPSAQAAGMREVSTFKPIKVKSDGNPDGSGLYSWPSKAAANGVRNNPTYLKDYKPLRSQAWNQLQSVDMEISSPLELVLDKTKTYSLSLLWLSDRTAYDTYYQGTQELRDRLGAKTLIKLPGVRYDKLTDGEITPPDLVVLVQWDSLDDLASYPKSAEFQAHQRYFEQGIKDMQLYRLGFWQ